MNHVQTLMTTLLFDAVESNGEVTTESSVVVTYLERRNLGYHIYKWGLNSCIKEDAVVGIV